MTFFLLIVVGLTLAFGFVFRARVASAARGISYDAMTSWNDFQTFIWPVIRGTVNGLLIPFGVLWVVGFVVAIGTGIYANSVLNAVILYLLLPIWLVAFIMPVVLGKVWVIGPIVRIIKSVLSPVLAIAFIYLAIGVWSPSVKASMDRFAGNVKETIANSWDKNSLNSESEAGIKAEINQDTVVYDENSVPFPESQYVAKKGLKVEVVNLKNDVHNMFLVRLPNKYGDITARSSEVYV
ncbi:MAG: alanine:cation symporter family protein, partial [Candidatus Moranbacteria bacterium]|nr:alanine:cation symporter family protein [Candidatus Moranbacteria bacterium]